MVLHSCFARDSHRTLVPCHQASSRDRRNDHRSSHLRHRQSPRMLPDLLLLVHRLCPSSSPHTLPSPWFVAIAAENRLAHAAPEREQARPASLGQEILGSRDLLLLRQVFPRTIQPPYLVSIFRNDQRPRSQDRQHGRPQLHAEGPAILWSLLTDRSISRPGFARRVLSTDHILHRTVQAPRRSHALQPHSRIPRDRADGRPDSHPVLYPTAARATDDVLFQEGGLYQGHDSLIWGNPVPLYGHFRCERHAAPRRGLRGDVGNIAVVSD